MFFVLSVKIQTECMKDREIERERVATFLRVHNSMLETGLNNVICSIIEGDKIKWWNVF